MQYPVIDENSDHSVASNFSASRWTYLYPTLVIVLSALFLFYKYLLQVSPSVMTEDLMRVFHVSGVGLGNLAATYFYTYIVAQLFVGVLLDKYSPRLLTTLAILCCAIASVIFARANSLGLAEMARMLIGVGAAFATISYMKLAAIWFPPHRFAFVGGLLATAAMVGALCGEAPLAFLVQNIGWRHSLMFCSFLGIFVASLFYLLVRDKNQQPLNKNQQPLILSSHCKNIITLKDILELLKNKKNWLLALYSGLSFAPVAVFGGLWGNPFLQEAYQLSKTQAAGLISLAFIGVAIGGPTLGYLADRFNKRIPTMILGTIFSFVALILVIYNSYSSTYWIGTFLFLFGFGIGSFMLAFAVGKEINKATLAATVIALINTGDAIFGAVNEPLVGKILDIFWPGKMLNGAPHFSVMDYRIALTLLPFDLLLALFFIWFFCVKSRHCFVPKDFVASRKTF
ncbi:MFS transporter [Coxiella-like endosymbiont of Rhipicephalus sanguineus]|uniref:MFS transporter n=1 Tax=Coxiella-like endosymbiont of Rhipicephalus sanguineus TaxID=1955402 RepID=UPI003557CFDA|nr:MFS transporter [Coxiella-like endosymbiont of Rhipicephalus sanguineus]